MRKLLIQRNLWVDFTRKVLNLKRLPLNALDAGNYGDLQGERPNWQKA
jgi:hypothetical protein